MIMKIMQIINTVAACVGEFNYCENNDKACIWWKLSAENASMQDESF